VSCILIGGENSAFTVGIAEYKATGEILPFFAVGPSGPIIKELSGRMPVGKIVDDVDEVARAVEVFSEHGTVAFLDTLEAGTNLANLIVRVMKVAADTDWVHREPQTMTMN